MYQEPPQIILATVPDPVHTHGALLFDRSIDASKMPSGQRVGLPKLGCLGVPAPTKGERPRSKMPEQDCYRGCFSPPCNSLSSRHLRSWRSRLCRCRYSKHPASLVVPPAVLEGIFDCIDGSIEQQCSVGVKLDRALWRGYLRRAPDTSLL